MRSLEDWLVAHRAEQVTVRPGANIAVLFPSDDLVMWYFVRPVEAGVCSCVVVFFRSRSRLSEGRARLPGYPWARPSGAPPMPCPSSHLSAL